MNVPNTKISFRIHSPEGADTIDMRTLRYFSKQDVNFFSKLPSARQQRFYTEVKTIVFPYGLNVMIFPKKYEILFQKTIFLDGLTKQYFFDSISNFIHALELISIAYESLTGSIVDPTDLT